MFSSSLSSQQQSKVPQPTQPTQQTQQFQQTLPSQQRTQYVQESQEPKEYDVSKESQFQQSTSISKNVSIRQNFHSESENLLNDVVNELLFDAYTCKSMAYYFDRDNVGLFGMADFNRWIAYDCSQKARIVMDYIVERGGEVSFDDIKKPDSQDWGSPLDSLKSLLKYKQILYDLVLKIHETACNNNDPHLTDFLETELIEPVATIIRKIAVLVSNLSVAGTGLGEYQFNKDLEKHLSQIITVSKLPSFHERDFEMSPF